MAIVPGWHTTIFAPYFVAGAIFSGVALVITLAVPMRKFFGLEDYLTVKHFEAMAKLCMLTSAIVLYAYLVEYFLAWYSGEPPERGSFWNRVFGHYWWANWIMLTCNGLVPLMLWFRRVRRSISALFVISIFINIGMWFERYVIIVTSLSHEYEPWAWGALPPLDHRDGDPARQLRLVRLLVPPLHAAAPARGDRGDEGGGAPRPDEERRAA